MGSLFNHCSLVIISGAIVSHLTLLGIIVQDDGGTLFGLAIIIFLGCLEIVYHHRREIPVIGEKLQRLALCLII